MTPPGWYQDPQNPAAERWWDGYAWGLQLRPKVHIPPALPGRLRGFVIGTVVVLLCLLVIAAATSSKSKGTAKGGDIRLHVDDGDGFGWANRVGSGAGCFAVGLTIACSGGSPGDRIDISPGRGSRSALLVDLDEGEGLVVRYDPNAWTCSESAPGTYGCQAD